MARKLRLAPKARSDLRQISAYIANDNMAAAERVLERINEVFRLLVAQPEAGRKRDELGDGLRSFATRTHVVFYEVRENSVDVIRVLDGIEKSAKACSTSRSNWLVSGCVEDRARVADAAL